jgi:transcriptional regulator of acetoin/glycerol metabolism
MGTHQRIERISAPAAPHTPEMRKIAQLWERFVTGHSEVDLSALSPVIRNAWDRSKQAGVDPALPRAPYRPTLPPFAQLREEIDWLSCAEPVLAFLRTALAEAHQLIMLGDHQGRVLFACGGHKALARAEELCGIPGGEWNEQQVGCSILGTSLQTGAPVQVLWQENYCLNWKDWVNESAPIYDPTTGTIVGVLGIAGYQELTHPRALELVINAVNLIESRIGDLRKQERLALFEQFAHLSTRYPSEGLLATDKHGKILAVSGAAEKQLARSASQLVGRRIQDIPALRAQHTRLVPLGSPQAPGPESRSAVPPALSADNPAVGTVVLLPQSQRPPAKRLVAQPWTARYTFADLIGQSPQLRECVALAQRASQHDWPVLLLGESGTGKELLAQAIHSASPRGDGPFVALNCAGITDDLIGAELFGYTEGSFTGALRGGKVGKIQLAHAGTLFLDDVDAMPLKMQASLLRVLEEGTVTPLGGRAPQRVNIRVIAASNGDLEQAVREQRFRHDLYYRLHVFPIALPPLRERGDDIPLLARALLAQHAPGVTVSPDALQVLSQYAWPGNVRELRNVLIAAAARARDGIIASADLPASLARQPSPPPSASPPLATLKDTEMALIIRTIRQTGSVPQAASVLGVHYSTLYRKLKRHNIALPPGPSQDG